MVMMPFVGSHIMTCNNECHLSRPERRAGEDWAMPLGTALYAPFDGEALFHEGGAGGWTITITATDPRLDRLTVQLMHLSSGISLDLGDSGPVVEGHIVGRSGGRPGAPGAGNSTGPHLHGHGILNGARIPLTLAIDWATARTPPTALKPEPTTVEDEQMKPLVFKRIEGKPEWCLIAPWIAGPGALEQGYRITTDPAVGLAWERMYERGSGTANNVDRSGYVTVQGEARANRAAWVDTRV